MLSLACAAPRRWFSLGRDNTHTEVESSKRKVLQHDESAMATSGKAPARSKARTEARAAKSFALADFEEALSSAATADAPRRKQRTDLFVSVLLAVS